MLGDGYSRSIMPLQHRKVSAFLSFKLQDDKLMLILAYIHWHKGPWCRYRLPFKAEAGNVD